MRPVPSARRAAGVAVLTVVGLAASGLPVDPLEVPPAAAAEPPPQPLHHWQLIEGRHWQIASPASEDVDATDAMEGTRGGCTAGMVEVRGRMLVDGWGDLDGVDAAQRSACVDWIDRRFPERCARFDASRWSALARRLPTHPMHFCIDRFEYPNRRGAYPWILVDWNEAGAVCARGGKRLCTEAEWTFACEGEEGRPYPNGYERDPQACVNDRPWRKVDAEALVPRDGERALTELDRLWQGEPSGARPRCRSPFGVYDMTGNVDEWTVGVVPGERRSILKGGYWGPVRTRCRPSTRVHGEDFAFYQQGFRCCSDGSH